MALVKMVTRSQTLKMDVNVNVLLPEKRYEKQELRQIKYPVVYVLHGFSENASSWLRMSILEYVARELDVVVVIPEIYNGFYTNHKEGPKYFSYITEELPIKMANFFPISTKREDTFVMGNSMGGYGAFKAALSYPEKYAAAFSFSGALTVEKLDSIFKNFETEYSYFKSAFPSFVNFDQSKDNLRFLAKKLAEKEMVPRLFHCCGLEDAVTYKAGKDFIDFLKSETQIEILYSEENGGHNWEFWNPYIYEAFKFFGFEIKKPIY